MKYDYQKLPLNIIIVGASGDLAHSKIVPALFGLFCRKLLPQAFQIIGFARSDYTVQAFRARLAEKLTCRYRPRTRCAQLANAFLARCFYLSGAYDDAESFLNLYPLLRRLETGGKGANSLFYLAVPPLLFAGIARALGNAGLVDCAKAPWSRLIVEKPFGMDRASSDQLTNELHQVFKEEQIYRIDHYLGKEVVQNLLVLRCLNTVFSAAWNRRHVERVEIIWHEDIGVGDRGGYFDRYGIIRDVMQNHLLQILALLAMEPPRAIDNAAGVRKAKARLLQAVSPARLADVVLGQYESGTFRGQTFRAYKEEAHVASASRTPTFAAVRLTVNNARWRGVPFYLEAGKAMPDKLAEIRIHFRPPAALCHCLQAGGGQPNRLIVRIQPDEALTLEMTNKLPGLLMRLKPARLNLRYAAAFRRRDIPQAYESLLWAALQGDRSLFIGGDELAAAWDVFTPVLREIEARRLTPRPYRFGSAALAAEAAQLLTGGLG